MADQPGDKHSALIARLKSEAIMRHPYGICDLLVEAAKALEQALPSYEPHIVGGKIVGYTLKNCPPVSSIETLAPHHPDAEVRRMFQAWIIEPASHPTSWEDCYLAGFRQANKFEYSAASATGEKPIPMVLHCPKCGLQHVDAKETHGLAEGEQEPEEPAWNNPPHRSHLCHGCGCIWRPADVPTDGVKAISTRGKADTWPLPEFEQNAPTDDGAKKERT